MSPACAGQLQRQLSERELRRKLAGLTAELTTDGLRVGVLDLVRVRVTRLVNEKGILLSRWQEITLDEVLAQSAS